MGVEMCLVMPAYRGIIGQLNAVNELGTLRIREQPVRLLGATHPETGVAMVLVDIPALFDRAGGPYIDASGCESSICWRKNGKRASTFQHRCEVGALKCCLQITEVIPGYHDFRNVLWVWGLIIIVLASNESRDQKCECQQAGEETEFFHVKHFFD